MRSPVAAFWTPTGLPRAVASWYTCLVMALMLGCGQTAPPAPRVPTLEQVIEQAISQLPPADQAEARLQNVCAVAGEPLGSMGVPVKLMLEGQPVFLCCEGCRQEAESHVAATLARIASLKADAATPNKNVVTETPTMTPSDIPATTAQPQTTVESQTTTP